MKYKYLVSVITVVYNGADLIVPTIDSVRKVKSADTEYIVVDGGSSDDTLSLVKEAGDVVDSWTSESDNGIFDAMNKGIVRANGQWLIFINAGDLLVLPSVETLALDQHRDCGIVYGNTIRSKGERAIPYDLSLIETGSLPMCHQSTLYNRAVLGERLYYNLEYRLYGENELLMRIYKENIPMAYVDVDIAFFLGDGISSQVSSETRKAKYKFLWRHYGLRGVMNGLALKTGLCGLADYKRSSK